MRKYGTAKEAFFEVGIQLFLDNGYKALSVSQICEASGASNGSFFHHFGSKGRFAAELYASVLARYHKSMLVAIKDAPSIEGGIASLISAHIEWVISNRESALFLLDPPNTEVLTSNSREIAAFNEIFEQGLEEWYSARCASENITPIPLELFYIQLIGPTQMKCRFWLSKRVDTSPKEQEEQLIQFAIKALV